ncbi:hypothetical protein D3C85_1258550 [compost metagenome]
MTEKRWTGRTVVCVASGPSLCAEDCQAIESAALPTIAVNQSWKLARFCDVIYAGDSCWWDAYGAEIDIPAERWTHNPNAAQALGINANGKGQSVLNSGYRAIELAISFGAARILLLGYDCSVRHGIHWHGAHRKTKNPDSRRCVEWLSHFGRLARHGAEVINCSRETELTCFPRMSFEEALCLSRA